MNSEIDTPMAKAVLNTLHVFVRCPRPGIQDSFIQHVLLSADIPRALKLCLIFTRFKNHGTSGNPKRPKSNDKKV